MKQSFKRNLQKGFTLVELLIVVIILAILAAIVVPQFSSSTEDAKLATLDTNLASLRTTLEVYKAQHGNTYPGQLAPGAPGAAPTCSGTSKASAGTAAVNDQLQYFSDAYGYTCTVSDTTNYRLGPYLRDGLFKEPVTNVATVAFQTTAISLTGTASSTGWVYNNLTGQIAAASNLTIAGKAVASR
jgi:prepilin-type N-terminal cleavage/methylation domain-containing protein